MQFERNVDEAIRLKSVRNFYRSSDAEENQELHKDQNEKNEQDEQIAEQKSVQESNLSKESHLKDNSNNSIVSDDKSRISEEFMAEKKNKLRSILDVIKKSYEEEKKKIERHKTVEEAKKKVFKIVKFLRTKNLLLKTIKPEMEEAKKHSFFIMHPELSNFRLFLDSIIIIIILYDSLYSPYKFFVREDVKKNAPIPAREMQSEIIVDFILAFDIFSTFFTAYFKNNVLVTDFRSIFINYIKFGFFMDLLYVLPFWTLQKYLYCLRMIKLFKFFNILRRIRYLLVKLFNLCVKSLKLIHSITNILIFTISLIYIIHYSACVFIFIGKMDEDDRGWLHTNAKGEPLNSNLLKRDLDETGIYIASIYLLMETFTTIGYGDINPKTTTEMLFLMMCEVLNVGLFAYLISCIMDIITRMSTDEISFKIRTDVDINSWLLKYNNKVPELLKIKMEKENSTLFEDVKKYFLLYYKNDNLWIKNFDFLRQMRPDIRKRLLNHLFLSLFKTFNYFFSQLEDSFKFKVALNLKSKIIEKNELIISENSESPKNFFKYIYFIGKGVVKITKENTDICQFESGSYFGDEYFLTNSPKFTYSNAKDSDMYLFCFPISMLNEICSYYEESYLMMLIKTLIRFSKIRQKAEQNGIKFYDKNNDFFKKIANQKTKKLKKIENTKFIDITEDSFKNDILIENLNVKNSPQVLELKDMEKDEKKENIEDKEIPLAQESVEYRENKNQIFSKDDISSGEKNILDNIGSSSMNRKWEEDQVFKNSLNYKEVQVEEEEEEDVFDNLDFLDKIEFNEENLGEMIKLKNRAEKFQDYKEYLKKLVKKLAFLNFQIDFLTAHYESIKTKSTSMIENFDKNSEEFFR